MAESNATQVILTDDGLKIIKAQNTADNAVQGVTDLNDPNLMSVIEKQNNIGQFAGLTSQYNVLVQNAKDEGINTDSLTTAYNNLNKFMADVLADPDHVSDVDRKTYKNYQDSYNSELAKIQTALKNSADSKFISAASATSQAASTASQASSQAQSTADYANSQMAVQSQATAKAQSTADNAFSQAQEVGSQAGAEIVMNSQATAKAQSAADNAYSYANSQMAVQSNATAKAQSTADNAFNQATTAIDNGKVTSQAVTDLKDGSKLTIADLENGLATKVANSEYASYKVQTASQIASKVDNGDFQTYQTQTSKLIESKVDNGPYQTDKTQTAKDIASKVSSNDFNTYQTQTADLIDSKVSNSAYASDKIQTASQIAQKVDNGAFSAYQTTTADLIAQKVANSDFSAYQATTAKSIDSKVESSDFNTYKTQTADLIDDKVSSSAYASDKTQTASEIADRVSNSAFSTYKTQTASQIAQKVDNGAFSAYQTTTADLIAQKVATSDFSAYQATTAKEISSKVESSDFQTYKTQTDGMIASKVSTADFNNLTISNRNLALGTATPITFTGENINNQAKVGYQFSSVIPLGTVVTVTFDVSSTTGVGDFVMQFDGDDTGSNWQAVTEDNLVNGTKHVSVTLTTAGTHLHIYPRIDFATGDIAFSNFIISESSKEVSWTPAPEDQATQSQITQLSDDINLRVTKDGLIDQINLQAGKSSISSSGQLTISAKTVYFDTTNPVIIPSANIDSLLVGKKLTAADIAANTFTTNNGTFTVDSNGSITAKNMTIIGGTLTSPTINTSTINGSTIYGTTFHAGDLINDANNTNNFYPFTIEPTGKASTTLFNSMDALRTEISGGGLTTMYRAINSSGSQYEAYDGYFSGDGIYLNSGFTDGRDMWFSQSVSGSQLTGQVAISPLDGIHLWGSTQSIHFSGLYMNGTGITFNSYGNIIADQDSTWWRVTNFSGSDIANFGTDTAGSNPIQFNRELDVGNININTAHSIISNDGKGLYINSGKGGRADLNVASLNYTGSVSKSLLSEKRDIKKVDTSYWSQLVNSIDLATYQYKTDDNTSSIRLSGIVDDVNTNKQWQLPDVFVARDEDGKLAGIENTVLQNAMLATVQEQQKEIDKLNGHLLELEAKLNG